MNVSCPAYLLPAHLREAILHTAVPLCESGFAPLVLVHIYADVVRPYLRHMAKSVRANQMSSKFINECLKRALSARAQRNAHSDISEASGFT